MLEQDSSSGPKVAPFSGSSDEGMRFSVWLRRLEDIIRMRTGLTSSEQNANILIDRKPGESSSAFANKVLNLVRAATDGQDPQIQIERTSEEFVARLRDDGRYSVKLDNPASFEQAVSEAQMAEQLLTEAAADRLMHLGTAGEAQVRALERVPVVRAAHGRVGRNEILFRGTARVPDNNQCRFIDAPRQRQPKRGEQLRGIHSFDCGGLGHLASHCPSPSPNNRRMAREAGRSFSSRVDNRRSFIPSRGSAKLMSREPSLRSSSDPEDLLRSAHQRIAGLSIEVDRVKVELDDSQARVLFFSFLVFLILSHWGS
ncbi:unnamed protein product [Nippostrongylus brasiliensis]|uniref:CCHC-type domain-containing protein n=1 Tax=Nippostrongylus brasiliensis TaxID=27835 RepID=A0A0N4XX20_NIPBR|nr:unnamed protein product [Nippostrongylus brasiliensis]